MYIKNVLDKKRPSISFEIFPPKKNYPIDTIYDTINDLSELNPDFISVTYGAGGSTKDTTSEVASYIQSKKQTALAHLTCLTSSKDEIDDILSYFENNNVKNILALRGDYPHKKNSKDITHNDYKYAQDLIYHIKEWGEFCIGAACYPEKHPESTSIEKDLYHLKSKVEAGTDFLITQLFLDNNIFYDYAEKLQKKNINVPILAGILPVLNIKQISKITSLTECTLPDKFKRIISKYEHNPEALKEAGTAYAIEQIIDLLSWGIDGIHIYTMNKPIIARNIINNISIIRKTLNNIKAC